MPQNSQKVTQHIQKYSRKVLKNITNTSVETNLLFVKYPKIPYLEYHKIPENTHKCSKILENTSNILRTNIRTPLNNPNNPKRYQNTFKNPNYYIS